MAEVPQIDPTARDRTARLTWLRRFLLLHVAVRTGLALHGSSVAPETWLALTQWALLAACVAGLVPRLARLGTTVAAAALSVQVAGTMPVTANHVVLEGLCLALLALCRPADDDERDLALDALRWLVVIVLFFGGVQKAVYGAYFDGQFLAYATATEDRFAALFRWVLPADEFARLRSLGAAEPGMGPYRADSAVFIAMSNAAWLLEIGVALLLAFRRTRALGAVAAVLLVVSIEAGARELLFGALIVNLLLVQLPGRWTQWLFPAFAALYGWLLASAFGLVPMFRYYQ